VDQSELPFTLGNALLFAAALFGVIASFSRPPRLPNPEAARLPWTRWNLSLFDVLFLLFCFGSLILFAAPLFGLFFSGDLSDVRIYSAYATPAMQIGIIVIVVYAARNRHWSLSDLMAVRGVKMADAAFHAGHVFLRYLPLIWLVGLFWGGLLLGLKELGLAAPVEPQIATQWITESESASYLILMAILVVVGAPISEELLFRGLLFRFLKEKTTARLALIISSLLFALLHANAYSFLPLFFIGLLLAKVYDDTRDLRTPIFFHLYFNLFSFLNLLFMDG